MICVKPPTQTARLELMAYVPRQLDATRRGSMQRLRRVAHGGPLFRVMAEDEMAALPILKRAQAGEGLDHQFRVPGGTCTLE